MSWCISLIVMRSKIIELQVHEKELQAGLRTRGEQSHVCIAGLLQCTRTGWVVVDASHSVSRKAIFHPTMAVHVAAAVVLVTYGAMMRWSRAAPAE
jgi:hypothetical protein